MKESINYMNNLEINKNEYLVVATSGGPDSMALLHLLKNNGYKVICAHVNHNLRSVSDEEYIFVENYCKENSIIFEGMKIESYTNNKFTEMEARIKRYDFFENILNKYNSKILCTAHHGDDLIETVLMRIIRGSNLNGYKGFNKISKFKDYNIIRPLIFYTKKAIENYVSENNIPCVYDESNKSKKYTRNRIRLDILPLLKQEEKNIHKKVLEFSEELNDIQEYISEQVNKTIKNIYKENILDLIKYNKLNKLIKKKVLETILFNIYNDEISLINKNHIKEIEKIINLKGNKEISLPNNIIIKKQYEKLIFTENKKNNSESYKYILENYIDIENYGRIEYISDTVEKSNYVIKLNSKDISLPLIIRNKKDGDSIKVKNLNGSKKIKNIFIDEKLPKEERNFYPVLTDSKGIILWIPGIKKSIFDCYNSNNYDIIIKYIKKGE